ncbi:hypothetical protein FJTKL_03014 [Diaporthe vaccinii]|uniref:Uncharacterized protein n=1 Tax=Diaporthe vaccinii TaxID=105482 RepID=A0ABR4DWP7_9PEZI
MRGPKRKGSTLRTAGPPRGVELMSAYTTSFCFIVGNQPSTSATTGPQPVHPLPAYTNQHAHENHPPLSPRLRLQLITPARRLSKPCRFNFSCNTARQHPLNQIILHSCCGMPSTPCCIGLT